MNRPENSGKSAGGAEFVRWRRPRSLIVDDEPGMRNFGARWGRAASMAEAADTDEASRMSTEPVRRRHPRQHHAGQNGVQWLARRMSASLPTPSRQAYADLDTAIRRCAGAGFRTQAVPLEPDIERGGASRPGRLQRRLMLRYALRASSDRTFLLKI
jgi:hypothetical protein